MTLVLLILGLVVFFIWCVVSEDKKKKAKLDEWRKREKEEYEERQRKEEQKRKEYERKIEGIKNTDFFKDISNQLEKEIKKELQEEINSGKYGVDELPCLQWAFAVTNARVQYSEKCGGNFNDLVNFNDLGYKSLSDEEKDYLVEALATTCFVYYFSGPGYCSDVLRLNKEYWEPIIREMMGKHEETLKNPF